MTVITEQNTIAEEKKKKKKHAGPSPVSQNNV